MGPGKGRFSELAPGSRRTLGREVNWDPGPCNISSSVVSLGKFFILNKTLSHSPILAVPHSRMLLHGVTIDPFLT